MYVKSLILVQLVLSSFTNTVFSSIYYITASDNNSVNNTNCLNYYVAHSLQYFTSHTQLKLLPGIHDLNMVITIQNIYDFSFSGMLTSDGTIDTIIQCSASGGMVIINSDSITIENLIIIRCKTKLNAFLLWNSSVFWNVERDSVISLVLQDSYSVIVQHVTIVTISTFSIVLHNVFENSCLKGVSSDNMLVMYSSHDLRDVTVQNSSNKLVIIDYHFGSFYEYKLNIMLFDHSYHIEILILQVNFQCTKAISITTYTCYGLNEVKIHNCSFTNVKTNVGGPVISVQSGNDSCKNIYKKQNVINISDCLFANNTNDNFLDSYMIKAEVENLFSFVFVTIKIINCEFTNNTGYSIFKSDDSTNSSIGILSIVIYIY